MKIFGIIALFLGYARAEDDAEVDPCAGDMVQIGFCRGWFTKFSYNSETGTCLNFKLYN